MGTATDPVISRRVSRRSVLAGGIGAAVFAACGGGSKAARPAPTATPMATAPGTSTRPAAAATPAPRRGGGIARLVAPGTLVFDTFDALRSGEPALAEILGRTHSRVVEWASYDPLRIGGDLAERWEQADAETWLFHLNPRARWQPRPPVEGRAVTAADVAAHLERAGALARAARLPAAQHQAAALRIRSAVATDVRTVRVQTDGPDPFLLHTLAARLAFVQAPEAVEAFAGSWHLQRPAEVAGSGPFIFQGPNERTPSGFTAFLDGHRPPDLDGIELEVPGSSRELLLLGASDEALLRDRRDAPALRARSGLTEFTRLEESPVITTLSTSAPPWNNPELVRALSGALHRGWLGRELFGGRALPGSPIDPVFGAPFALAATDLARFPGYGPSPDGDAADARRRWDAAGGAALGTVRIDFPSVFDPAYGASAVVTARLAAVLGNRFVAAVEPYTTIGERASAGEYGNARAAFWFGWGPPFDDPDPSRLLAATYAPGLPALAKRFDELLNELDSDVRARSARELALAALAEGSGVLSWLVQRQELFRVAGLRRPEPSPFWLQHRDYEARLTT